MLLSLDIGDKKGKYMTEPLIECYVSTAGAGVIGPGDPSYPQDDGSCKQ